MLVKKFLADKYAIRQLRQPVHQPAQRFARIVVTKPGCQRKVEAINSKEGRINIDAAAARGYKYLAWIGGDAGRVFNARQRGELINRWNPRCARFAIRKRFYKGPKGYFSADL